MCSSVNSSKIATSRGVKSKNIVDTDLLFSQLKEFLPYVKEMIFTGGEPFLSRFYFNVWEEIIAINPTCKITLNTNCTVLTNEAKEIIEKGQFQFNVSLDSVSKETYERIRKNADFETTFHNFAYLADYSKRNDVPIAVPVCPLVLNYKEIPDIIKFCNTHNAFIVFVHVFSAHNVALSAADVELLADALAYYKQVVLPNSSNAEKQNANQFAGLIADVIEWKEMARQREEFIKSISKGINNGVFVDKLKLLKNDLGAETQCLDEVFNLLPDYYRTPEFISALSRYSTQTISNYLKEIPSIEIAEYFQMIFNQLVNAKD
jgi:molybdenum cofactor biosynthesis enzyme MoaA